MSGADLLYGLAIVAGAIALVAAEELLATWAVRRSTQAILGRRCAVNTHGGAEKPNAPDCSEAFAAPLTGRGGKAAGRYPTRASIMPDAHRDVKHNTPPRAAGGSDAEHREP